MIDQVKIQIHKNSILSKDFNKKIKRTKFFRYIVKKSKFMFVEKC